MGADAQCMRLQLLVSQMLSINNNNNDSNNRRCFPAQDELGMCGTSLVSPKQSAWLPEGDLLAGVSGVRYPV